MNSYDSQVIVKRLTIQARMRVILAVISERQNHRCCYCGIRTNEYQWEDHSPTNPTIEHIIPVGMGGPREDEDNCVMACGACNNNRNNTGLGCWLIVIELPRSILGTYDVGILRKRYKKALTNKPMFDT